MKIHIPEPCHENWDKMTPEENGRFCLTCSKVVVDFTQMSMEEIQNYFINHADREICGTFRQETIDINPLINSQFGIFRYIEKINKIAAVVLLVFFVLFTSCKINQRLENTTYIQKEPSDLDKDGMPDLTDDCPFLPGKSEYFGCPDSEGDGIGDSKDSDHHNKENKTVVSLFASSGGVVQEDYGQELNLTCSGRAEGFVYFLDGVKQTGSYNISKAEISKEKINYNSNNLLEPIEKAKLNKAIALAKTNKARMIVEIYYQNNESDLMMKNRKKHIEDQLKKESINYTLSMIKNKSKINVIDITLVYR